jgi:hypothetical protein
MRNTDIDTNSIELGQPTQEPAADAGIGAPQGLLGGMLSWIRKLIPSPADVAAAAGDQPANRIPEVGDYVALPSKNPDGEFDAATLMRALLEYHERHKERLHGAGLLLGLTGDLPPPAFPEIARMPGYIGGLDTLSLIAADYPSIDDARATLKIALTTPPWNAEPAQTLELATVSPRQLAWLTNAAALRAAVKMAPYALGALEFIEVEQRIVEGAVVPTMVVAEFAGTVTPPVPSASLDFPGGTRPHSLGRELRSRFDLLCRDIFQREVDAVALEVQVAARAGFEETASDLKSDCPVEHAIGKSAAFMRLKNSYLAFSDIRQVIEVDKAFQSKLDRQALGDAIRHSAFGTYLQPYLVHVDPALQADIAMHRERGALAFGHYSNESLAKLMLAHSSYMTIEVQGINDVEVAVEPDADVAKAFATAIEVELAPQSRALLAGLTPRYLGALIVGSGQTKPLVKEPDVAGSLSAARSAGMRFGRALQAHLGDKPTLARLPWAAALTIVSAKALMADANLSDADAVKGLTALFGYVNKLRAQGQTNRCVEVFDFPNSATFASASFSQPAESVVGLLAEQFPSAALTSARRTALSHLKEMLLSSPKSVGMSRPRVGRPAQSAEWKPSIARLLGGRKLGSHDLLDDGTYAAVPLSLSIQPQGTESVGWAHLLLSARVLPDNMQLTLHALQDSENPTSTSIKEFKTGVKAHSPAENAVQLSGGPMTRPAYVDSKRAGVAIDETALQSLTGAWSTNLQRLFSERPLDLACVMRPVAQHLLDSPRQLPTLNSQKTFRLARVSLGTMNHEAIALVVAQSKNPLVMTTSGRSLLDLALEGKPDFARSALRAIITHPKVYAEVLTPYLQRSLGKLVETHPQLLPDAIACGARLDADTHRAWAALHPQRLTPEAESAMTAARMAEAIQESVAAVARAQESAGSPPAPAARKRRMGV